MSVTTTAAMAPGGPTNSFCLWARLNHTHAADGHCPARRVTPQNQGHGIPVPHHSDFEGLQGGWLIDVRHFLADLCRSGANWTSSVQIVGAGANEF
jgi:hypothetical protein